jgi:hypothetical protein
LGLGSFSIENFLELYPSLNRERQSREHFVKGESAIIIILLIIIHNMYNKSTICIIKVQCQNNWYNFNNLIILYYSYYDFIIHIMNNY